MKLYAWQQQCLNAWESHEFRGIVNVVTGAGKTVLALSAMDLYLACYPDAQIRIVVPTIPLARQWQRALLHHAPPGGEIPGLFGAGSRDSADRQIMIYIINSARDALPKHMARSFVLGRHVLLICDECHHCQSPENRKIFSFITPDLSSRDQYACMGLSATPFGTANDDVLTAALGPEIYRYAFAQAAEDQIISPFTVSEVSVSFLPAERARYQRLSQELASLLARLLKAYPELKELAPSAFQRAVMKLAHAANMNPENVAVAFLLKTWERKGVCTLAEARLLCALDLISRCASHQRVLIFCERIVQAEQMASVLRRGLGLSCCGVYHSGMTHEARERVLKGFHEKQFSILISCRCLDEGIDVPDAALGIVLSSSAVPRQRIQRLGRILRKSEGKESANLYYLYIRESAEDPTYLPGLTDHPGLPLRYTPLEHDFTNDVYEYAALRILEQARARGLSPAQIQEIRLCLMEGLPRMDCLLPPSAIQLHLHTASTRHLSNYWKVMAQLHRIL